MRGFLVLLICLFIVSSNLLAQIGNINDVSGTPLKSKEEENIEGSQYLFNGDWTKGKIEIGSNTEIEDVPIRYNSFKDHVEILKSNGDILKVDIYSVNGFTYERLTPEGNIYKYEFENVKDKFKDSKYNKNFLRLIYDGKFKLYMDHKVIMQKVAPPTYGGAKVTKFIPQETLFMVNNNKVYRLKLSRRAFKKAFPSLKNKIKDYDKRFDIDYENEVDLIKLCEFINEEI